MTKEIPPVRTIPARMPARPTFIKLPRLIEWRIRCGLSQEKLAERADISRATLTRIEGNEWVRPSTAYKLSIVLGCSVDDLMEE